MSFLQKSPTEKKFGRLLFVVLAIFIAIIYDVLFWYGGAKQVLGANLFLFTTLSMLGISILLFIVHRISVRWAALLLLPIGIMSLAPMFYNNQFVTGEMILILLVIVAFFVMLLPLKNVTSQNFALTGIPLVKDIDLLFRKWANVLKDLFSLKSGSKSDLARKIAIGIILSVPVLLVFGWLFLQADTVFAEIFNNIFTIEGLKAQHFWRVFRTVLIGLWLSGLFYAVIDKAYVQKEGLKINYNVDHVIFTVVLALVNFLFLAFIFIQIKYFFGGAPFLFDGKGMTYAQYARNGFFELAWVIVLAGALLSFIYKFSNKKTKLLTFLQVALIAQVGVVAYSALTRMNLYQEAYGFTVLRLYVEWTIYFILVVLFMFAIMVFTKAKYKMFMYFVIILGLISVSLLSIVNVDGMIAKKNVDRYINEEKELDMKYLTTKLSIDAISEVDRAFREGYVYEMTSCNIGYALCESIKNSNTNVGRKYYVNYNYYPHLYKKEINKYNLLEVNEKIRSFNFGRLQASQILSNHPLFKDTSLDLRYDILNK